MRTIKILITGSSGFLGRATIELFTKDSNYEVFELGRQNHPIRENYIYSNLAKEDFSSLKDKISANFDTIIHLAAFANFSENFDPKLFQINTIATSLLADIASEKEIRFVFASAATVVGSQKACINSKLRVFPNSYYMLSKWLAERYLIAKLERPLILRFGGIFGFSGPSYLSLNRSITEALMRRKIPEVYGLGKAKRNYIYVKDAAKAIKYGIEKNIKDIHFIAGSELLSIQEIIAKICNLYISNSKPIYMPSSEAKDQIVEVSRCFPKTSSFEEALKDIKKNYINHFYEN